MQTTFDLKSEIPGQFYLHEMKHQYRVHVIIGFLIFFFSFFLQTFTNAQAKIEIAQAKKIFDGLWVNAKTKRYIQIFFDADVDYVTINDWTGSADKRRNGNIDAYKAIIENGKLVMPAEDGNHQSSYCEMEMINRQLIYRCKGMFADKNKFINKTVFKRVKN